MVGQQGVGSLPDAQDASATRGTTQMDRTRTATNTNKKEGRVMKGPRREHEIMQKMAEIKKISKEGLQLATPETTLAMVLANIVGRVNQLETATRLVLNGNVEKSDQDQKQILLDIQKKIGAMEARFGGGLTSAAGPTTNPTPTWSSVVQGSHLPARIEVRLEEMEEAEKETSEGRLNRIRKAIPDVKAVRVEA